MVGLFFAGFSVASGGLAASLAAFRIPFIVLSVLTLGLAYWQIFVRRRGHRRNRVILAISTVVTIFSWLAPSLTMWIRGS